MMPRATMRLQFHKGFTFADAEKLVPYFARLGISHVYASPITTARPVQMLYGRPGVPRSTMS